VSRSSDTSVLIGTADAETLSQLAGEDSVELAADPEALLEALDGADENFDIVLVDVDMASATGADLLQQKPVLITPRAHLLEAVREVRQSRGPNLTEPMGVEVVRAVTEKALSHDHAAEAAASAPEGAIGGLLTRRRSAAEESALRRRALHSAFEERKRLLSGSWSTQEVAQLLGSTRQTPYDRVKSKTLLAVEDNGQLRFPPWQFDADGPNGVVEGLPDVLKALSVGPLAKARWLQRPNPIFRGRTPLEALQSGERERVLSEAWAVAGTAGGGSG